MKWLSLLAAGLSAIPIVSSHYVFSKFIVNGLVTKDFEYIRRNSNNYMPTTAPNILNTDFRCNEGSMSAAANTKVYTIAPGATLGFQLAYGATMQHPGPLQVYMSKAPGDVRQYDGSGDWFLVYQMGLCQDISDGLKDTDWCTWDKATINFKLPNNTPPGQYLVRVEHLGLHRGHSGNTEFYFTCAQINVTGNGNGAPNPLVKIPGVYKPTDPNISFNIYVGPKSYTLPGPAVWTGSGGNTVTTPPPTSGTAAKWGQCGGIGWTGPTACVSGSTCVKVNDYYSQCQ